MTTWSDTKNHHAIAISTMCPYTNMPCAPGLRLMERLNGAVALAVAAGAADDDFEIGGFACVEDCARSCMIGFQASTERSYLFGGVPLGSDLGVLVAQARRLAQEADGTACAPPRGNNGKTPAVLVVTEKIRFGLN